ncbi:hypothetical protein EZS27_034157, partial [termite gut metagenome]
SSVSIMTQTTSGIENLFSYATQRKRKIEKNSVEKPDYINVDGDWFTNYNTLHKPFIDWYMVYMDSKGSSIDFNTAKSVLENTTEEKLESLYKLSPYFGTTINDVNWEEKVKMQGAIQKFVDHSISVTVNLPKNTTVDVIAKVYQTAWESGCKGITVYRDGCKENIISTKKTIPVTNDEVLPRPKILPCKIIRFTNKNEKWVSVVGILNEKPYEIFTGLLEKLNIPLWVENGEIVRNKELVKVIDENTGKETEKEQSRYDFQYKDQDGFSVKIEGLSRIFNPEYWNYSKLFSGLLRNNVSIEKIIDIISSLNLDNNINTWKNGIKRSLKTFLAKEEETKFDICPHCGEKTLINTGGCMQCTACGWSKCN